MILNKEKQEVADLIYGYSGEEKDAVMFGLAYAIITKYFKNDVQDAKMKLKNISYEVNEIAIIDRPKFEILLNGLYNINTGRFTNLEIDYARPTILDMLNITNNISKNYIDAGEKFPSLVDLAYNKGKLLELTDED